MVAISQSIGVLPLLHGLVAGAPAPAPNQGATPGRYMFTFGDSYTSTGFYLHGDAPNNINPLGNPGIGQPTTMTQAGTFTGGYNYIDYLTVQRNTTLTYTYDLAVGGATVDNAITKTNSPSFNDQLFNFFYPYYSDKPSVAPWSSDNTIFIVHFGINDIYNNYRRNPINNIIPQTIDRYFKLLQYLHDTGARKMLLVNVPDVGSSAKVRGEGGSATWKTWTNEFNKRIAAGAKAFGQSHSDTQIAVYDFQSYMNKVVKNPSQFGFRDSTCRGQGNACIWQDELHVSAKFDEGKAADMIPTLQQLG